MISLVVKNEYQKDTFYDEIGLCAQYSHLSRIVNKTGRIYLITQREKKESSP
jgi:hypothetical protein